MRPFKGGGVFWRNSAHQPFAAPVATLKKSQNFSGDLLMFFERKIFFCISTVKGS